MLLIYLSYFRLDKSTNRLNFNPSGENVALIGDTSSVCLVSNVNTGDYSLIMNKDRARGLLLLGWALSSGFV